MLDNQYLLHIAFIFCVDVNDQGLVVFRTNGTNGIKLYLVLTFYLPEKNQVEERKKKQEK